MLYWVYHRYLYKIVFYFKTLYSILGFFVKTFHVWNYTLTTTYQLAWLKIIPFSLKCYSTEKLYYSKYLYLDFIRYSVTIFWLIGKKITLVAWIYISQFLSRQKVIQFWRASRLVYITILYYYWTKKKKKLYILGINIAIIPHCCSWENILEIKQSLESK